MSADRNHFSDTFLERRCTKRAKQNIQLEALCIVKVKERHSSSHARTCKAGLYKGTS